MIGQLDRLERIVRHDGVVHHPLGGGSYIFRNNFVDYVAELLYKDSLRISLGAKPNSSPHFGTLTVFCLAFSLGQRLKSKKSTEIFFEVIDTAPHETRTIDGIRYQVSLRDSGKADKHLADYLELLDYLALQSGIPYKVRRQAEFNSQPNVSKIVKKVILQRNEIAPILDPEDRLVGIRIACPDCGLTDKDGVKNQYGEHSIESYCPDHGLFKTDIDKEPHKLEYNTPLRNLIRALIYSEDNNNKSVPFEWLRVTGSDYAGFYQEQLLYNCASRLDYPAHHLPKIVYSPLVVDWSGSKLSKTLYVKEGAYKYLPPYLVNFTRFKEKLGEDGIKKLFQETSLWLNEPYRLFRNYSVYYFMELFGYDE